MIIQVGGNTLDCDVEATVAAFQGYDPQACECNGCRNFRESREAIFAGPVLDLFSQFGIDTNKPAETYTLGRPDERSLLRYGGWFHFIGEAIRDDDVVEFSENLTVYFLRSAALVPRSFTNRPVVQLEFEWKIPWLLAEPWED